MSDRPMRVLLVTPDFPPFLTGVGDYTDKLAAHLTAAGADVTVLTTADDGDAADDERPFVVCRGMADWGWSRRNDLVAMCAESDVVHVQYPGVRSGRSLLLNALPWLLRRRGVRTVVTLHEFRTMRARWRMRAAVMLGGADVICHVDADDAPLIRRWSLPRRPTRVLPIGSNVEPVEVTCDLRRRWRGELNLAADETAVVFFGILYPHKGVAEMLDAVVALRASGRRVRPVVVGDFDRDAAWRAALESQLSSADVVWVRGASLGRVSEVLHAGDLAVLPFHSGAATNRSSLLASLDHGLPAVSTSGPHTPAGFGEKFDVRLVPPRDPAALAKAVGDLIDDPAARARMRAAGLSRRAAGAWPAIAARQLEIYREFTA